MQGDRRAAISERLCCWWRSWDLQNWWSARIEVSLMSANAAVMSGWQVGRLAYVGMSWTRYFDFVSFETFSGVIFARSFAGLRVRQRSICTWNGTRSTNERWLSNLRRISWAWFGTFEWTSASERSQQRAFTQTLNAHPQRLGTNAKSATLTTVNVLSTFTRWACVIAVTDRMIRRFQIWLNQQIIA